MQLIKNLFEEMLDDSMVQITVVMDPEAGARVPDNLRSSEAERFNLSWKFKSHMKVLEDGIEATLSFSDGQFDCWFPWVSVIGFVHMKSRDRYMFGQPPDGGSRVLVKIDKPPEPEAHLYSANSKAPDVGCTKCGRPLTDKIHKRDHLRMVK